MKWKGVMCSKGEMWVRTLEEGFVMSVGTRYPLPIKGSERKWSRRSEMAHGVGSENERIWSPLEVMI